MSTPQRFARLTADEAAAMVQHGQQVAMSGFTVAGTPKAVGLALARRSAAEHAAGRPWQIRLLTGASTGPVDDALAEARGISWRAPFQSSRPLREQINRGEVAFADLHLSHVPQYIAFGHAGTIDWAIVEATEVTEDGRVYLTTGIGITPTILQFARRVIIEVNRRVPREVRRMHDLATLPPPPLRDVIPIRHTMERIGADHCALDPAKIVGVVESDEADGVGAFDAPTEASARIAGHIVSFLREELESGRVPPSFLPVQAGVGNVSNAVLAALGASPDIPPFEMYTEVMQDSQVSLLEQGRIMAVSTCALATSDPATRRVLGDVGFFGPRVLMRPQELSNNPGVIRRLGIIAINTVLEMDIYGCANSTHVCGTQMMNGVGGSGDFTRNAYLSILMAPSAAKGGTISTVVPMVTHADHTEHSVQVLVTEQGLADLRGQGPMERARLIIDRCAHPTYRPYLHDYLAKARPGHFKHDLDRAFELHRNLLKNGRML
jgi:acetyl-CoA hydrolase